MQNEAQAITDQAYKVAAEATNLADMVQAFLIKYAPPKDTQSAPALAKAEKPQKVLALEDVRKVLADKSRQGFTADVKALLQKFGADKLSAVNPSDYAALLTEAEVIGNG